MSIFSCSCVALFLLCLSLHACSARRDLIGSVERHKKSQFKPHFFSNKGHEAETIPLIEKSGDQSVKSSAVPSTDDHKTRGHLNKVVSSKDAKRKGFSGEAKYQRTKKSKDSVSWLVPHKKRGEKQPGFNLDYSPPKTHPPSHN